MALASLNTAIICCIRSHLLDELQGVYMMRRKMKEARTILHEMAVWKAHRSWSRCCHD